MKNNRTPILFLASYLLLAGGLLPACTKYAKGFLSPTVQYGVSQFNVTRGRISSSYTLVTDGSSIPLHVKWVHIYDSTGAIVDSLFTKLYPVTVWTAAYNPAADTTYAALAAKRAVANLPPITVNESDGSIQANSATIYIPTGAYKMDIQVSNVQGTEILKKIMQINLIDGKPLETSPEQGAFSNSLLVAGGAAGARANSSGSVIFNGNNNPFDVVTVTRVADTPNIIVLKVTDRNGVPFDPKTGEIAKRPNTGLNPNPPFLQNLQDYGKDGFTATDTAISAKFALTPFPIASLGNGFNLYYDIHTAFIHIDSTAPWTSNTAGNFYQGTADPHYKGQITDGRADYSLRIPMRIWVPGSYEIVVKILDVTHR